MPIPAALVVPADAGTTAQAGGASGVAMKKRGGDNERVALAHCNFPYPTPTMVPVKHLGYDVPRILEACIENIDSRRRDGHEPATTSMPALFEEEAKAGTCRSKRENGKASSELRASNLTDVPLELRGGKFHVFRIES